MPPLPVELTHVLNWYYELASRRAVTSAGAQAISYQEILAWMACTRLTLDPLEIDMICRLDDVYRSEVAERSRAESTKRENAQRNASAKAASSGGMGGR
jgi:hypothetical protein